MLLRRFAAAAATSAPRVRIPGLGNVQPLLDLVQPTEANLASVRRFLAAALPTAELAPALLLQTITHKLYADGLKPHNERLSFLGLVMLESEVSRRLATPDSVPVLVHECLSAPARYLYAQHHGLNQVVFWRSQAPEAPVTRSGELTVHLRVLTALVGAVWSTHGEAAARELTDKVLAGDHGLLAFAQKCLDAKTGRE